MSTLATIAQALADHSRWLADPTPTPGPAAPSTPTKVHLNGAFNFIITWVLPLVIAGIGVMTMRHAKKGDMNATLTSFSIVVIGVVLIASAGAMFLFGQYLVNLVVS
jgi:hypothetical protein